MDYFTIKNIISLIFLAIFSIIIRRFGYPKEKRLFWNYFWDVVLTTSIYFALTYKH
jgi:hypothetical protein